MGHVLIEMEKKNNTTESAKKSMDAIFKKCNVIVRYRLLNDITLDDLEWCDSYLAVRPNTPMALNNARAVKLSGRFYAALFDDDLINYKNVLSLRRKCARQCLKLSDVVISPNPVLAEEYTNEVQSKRKVVVNTPVSEDEIISMESEHEKIEIVYAAGRDHAVFFEKEIKPILGEFLEKYYDRVRFTFIGVEPDLTGIKHSECIEFRPLMPLADYNRFMRENRFDIGLAPLEDDNFSHKKYFNKFIEYSKVGILGIFSNCLPYTLIVDNEVNGLLVNHGSGNWFDVMCTAIENGSIRASCVHNAQELLRREFSLDSIANTFKTQVPEFESAICNNPITWRRNLMQEFWFKLIDRWQKFFYKFSNEGIKGTIKFILNFISDRKREKKQDEFFI